MNSVKKTKKTHTLLCFTVSSTNKTHPRVNLTEMLLKIVFKTPIIILLWDLEKKIYIKKKS